MRTRMCLCVEIHAGIHGVQKMVLDSLKLKLQTVVNRQMWVLGTGVRPSGGSSALDHRASSPALNGHIFDTQTLLASCIYY